MRWELCERKETTQVIAFMNRLLLLLLFYLACTSARAQTDDSTLSSYRNEITLTIGLSEGYFQDQNYSPLNYKSAGTSFGISYGRSTAGGHRLIGGFGVAIGTLRHRTDFEKIGRPDRYRLNAHLGYLRKAGRQTDARQQRFGVIYRSYVELTFYDGTQAVSFSGLHGFEAAAAFDWKMGDRHRLSTEISVPVFGLLVRPPYTGWDRFVIDNSRNIPKVVTRGDWVTIGAFAGLRAGAAWTYDLSDRWQVTARYDLALFATKRVKPVRILDNTVSFSSTLKF